MGVIKTSITILAVNQLFPNQTHSWTQLKPTLLQTFGLRSMGDDGIVSSGTQAEVRWGVMFGARCVYYLFVAIGAHTLRQMRHNSWL